MNRVLNIKTKEITTLVKVRKDLIMLVLSVSLVIGAMLIGGCVGKETETPPEEPEIAPPAPETPTLIAKSITPQEAFNLIQQNQGNPDFVIIDLRFPESFASEHIENAINLDYYSENFRDELDKLDRGKIYLIYCLNGTQSRSALDMMAELNFTEVYKISGGLNQWKEVGLATIQIPAQISESITAQEAFNLIRENQDNPNVVIIDIRTPEEFAEEHIENAINLDYYSESFRDELDKLDKDKIFLVYYTGLSGGIGEKTLDIMAELNFTEVYNISGGLDQWKEEGLPTIQPTPAQISESISAQEALNLIQENQDNPNFIIIDIRPPDEFAQWHVEGAINIDYHSEDFQEELGKLDKDKIYLIYYSCACGNIDKKALNMMAELGFKEVYKISGGLDQEKWEELQP